MMLFSTAAFGYTYNVTQGRRNSSYVVTKNGDVSSFMAMGTTGSGAHCRTSMNNSSSVRVKLTARVQKLNEYDDIVARSNAEEVADPAEGITTGNLARAYSSDKYNYRHLGEAYTYNTNAYSTKADAYVYVAKQIP